MCVSSTGCALVAMLDQQVLVEQPNVEDLDGLSPPNEWMLSSI